jgi:hypothetical protein
MCASRYSTLQANIKLIFVFPTIARQFNICSYSITTAACFGAICTIFWGVVVISIPKLSRLNRSSKRTVSSFTFSAQYLTRIIRVNYYFTYMFWQLVIAIFMQNVDTKEHLILKHIVVSCAW